MNCWSCNMRTIKNLTKIENEVNIMKKHMHHIQKGGANL